MTSRILVAGIGNIFLGDDGFGPEVIKRAGQRLADTDAHVEDYGIRGMHLAYDLLDDWDALVLVDAVPSRGSPGTLHMFEADHESTLTTPALDAHSMDPNAVFASLAALGGTPPYTVVVGCEVENVDEGIGLSPSVDAAVDGAVGAVAEVLSTLSARAATGGS
ncbi:hydrogenase maturation protease [Mycobacterium sp.]|uniref:hydrogenase maturation protease n=1 Tax=Mycobacterium sp. TaxID=1785 RepID=UPI003C7094D6